MRQGAGDGDELPADQWSMSVRSGSGEALPARDYIRGGGGVEVSRHRVAAMTVAGAVSLLLILAVILTVGAAEQRSRIDLVRRSGVPVDITVSSCLGMASGTGITASGFRCRGTFTRGGRTYDQVIGGLIDNRAHGDVLQGVSVPSDPTIVYTAVAAAQLESSWTVFLTPALLFVLAAGIVLSANRRNSPRRTDRRSANGGSIVYRPET
jgi:hypothetical protein